MLLILRDLFYIEPITLRNTFAFFLNPKKVRKSSAATSNSQFHRDWPNPNFSAQEQLIAFHFFHSLDIPKLTISKKSMDGPLRKLSPKIGFFTSTGFILLSYIIID